MNSYHKIATRTLVLSILSNIALASIKYSAGHYGHSYALIADSLESLTDSVSSCFLLVGIFYASKKSNPNYPYGYGKVESLMTVISIAFIILCAITITTQSVAHILRPHASPESFTLYILAAIIAWKELCFQYVYYRAHQAQSLALKSEAWHHRADAFTSIAAFIGISVALIMGPGYEHADDWAALVAAAVLFYNAYTLIDPAFNEIIDANVYKEVEENIRSVALSLDRVLKTEKCYIRKSGLFYHGELHVQINPALSVLEGHEIAHQVKRKVLEQMPLMQTLVIHIEPFESTPS